MICPTPALKMRSGISSFFSLSVKSVNLARTATLEVAAASASLATVTPSEIIQPADFVNLKTRSAS